MFGFIELILNMVHDILSAFSGFIDNNLSSNLLTASVTVYGQSYVMIDLLTTFITAWLVGWITLKIIMLPLYVIKKVKGEVFL